MKVITILTNLLVCFYSCAPSNQSEKNTKNVSIDSIKTSTYSAVKDTFINPNFYVPKSSSEIETNKSYSYDTINLSKIDTSTLRGKREYILAVFKNERIIGTDSDTLFDLNYDGNKDYIIKYYGLSGSGLKNKMEVYLFNTSVKNYLYDSTLSDLANPSFYIKEKLITGFYLANGGGGGEQLEWIKGNWICTKRFNVDNEEDTSKWEIHYPQLNKKEVIVMPYQMIPSTKILKTEVDF